MNLSFNSSRAASQSGDERAAFGVSKNDVAADVSRRKSNKRKARWRELTFPATGLIELPQTHREFQRCVASPERVECGGLSTDVSGACDNSDQKPAPPIHRMTIHTFIAPRWKVQIAKL